MGALDVTLATLKVIGILVTGLFGLAGALTNFRNDDGTSTVWGRRNIVGLGCGIVLSLGVECGTFIRDSIDAKNKRVAAEESQRAADKLIESTESSVERLEKVRQQLAVIEDG